MELLAFVGRAPCTWASSPTSSAYVVLVAFSIPGALIMTMSGGFLFGAALGIDCGGHGHDHRRHHHVSWSPARPWGSSSEPHPPAAAWCSGSRTGVRANAFVYLLILRLIPAVPFWLCNIASGFVSIPLRTYVAATILGIIPSTVDLRVDRVGAWASLRSGREARALGSCWTPTSSAPAWHGGAIVRRRPSTTPGGCAGKRAGRSPPRASDFGGFVAQRVRAR